LTFADPLSGITGTNARVHGPQASDKERNVDTEEDLTADAVPEDQPDEQEEFRDRRRRPGGERPSRQGRRAPLT
jgi:hypothetical protein